MNEREDAAFRAHLANVDPEFLNQIVNLPIPVLPPSRPPFESLVRIVVGQQLSTAAAQTVFHRLMMAMDGELQPPALQAASDALLRSVGLSGAKTRTIRALADFSGPEGRQLEALCDSPWPGLRGDLLKITGVGPWTVDMFGMFGLGLPDLFSAGDFALKKAMTQFLGIPLHEGPAAFEARALRWSPHRTLASMYLWKLLEKPIGPQPK
ncbi:MAG: DNA-3-methyladenine glycosylase 2 family protein [Bacteroidetes bacterium]|nr:DNA-3-methyladenine glycosylase 2 family protein [Bacteroidota bacterium]MDA0902759.1 DNA-3-methyladenine glycosylase 2 family protein [Bacteroidota bacterium]MDA1242896.1 DNA-3-methyladenine glycosylase 2 family protein [Bacteroidota bacterium]